MMMIDGIELKARTNLVAPGTTTEGVKIPLGLWEGSIENATVATALLSNLVDPAWIPSRGSCSLSGHRRVAGRPVQSVPSGGQLGGRLSATRPKPSTQ
jgi:hypothetical protein